MSDAATNFLSDLTASTDKATTAQSLLTTFRAGSAGSISQNDFQTIFAEMELQQPSTSTAQPSSGIQPTTFDVRRTIFECQLYPSYSNNYATAQYEASEMVKALDTNGDGTVSLSELEAYSSSSSSTSSATSSGSSTSSSGSTGSSSTSSTSTGSGTSSSSTSSTDSGSTSTAQSTAAPTFIAMPLTTIASLAETTAATNFATTALSTFDTTGKGYFTLSDVQAAYTSNSSLGDPAQAQADITQFDANGDGQVTQQELVNGYQQMDIANNLVTSFDPNNAGYIDLASVAPQIAGDSPSLASMIKSWDTDNNGQLTQSEILAGVKASSMSLSELSAMVEATSASINSQKTMAQFDATNKGYITATDLTNEWSSTNSTNDPATAQTAIAAWDENGDGQVNLGEMINGQQVTDLASQLLTEFDPTGQGYIDVTSAGATAMAGSPNLFNLIKSWDADNNGQVTQQEIMNGIQTSNANAQLQAKRQNTSTATDAASQSVSIMSQVDSNYDGQISLGEFLTYAGSDPSIAADPISTFNAWDTNQDGYLTLDELQTGIQNIQQAQSIVSQYDTANKGYFDINDLETALTSTNTTTSSSDIDTQAQQIMNFWDTNGDGKVTVQEVIQGVKSGGYVGGQQLTTTPAATG